MGTVLTTVPGHYDGEQIHLDAEVDLKPNTRLLITILDEGLSDEPAIHAAMKMSEASFAQVWDNDQDAVYDQL